MTKPDISIVLNAHREGMTLCYTLRSLVDTTLHANSKGLSVELIAVLDRPDITTRAVLQEFESDSFVSIKRIEADNGSLGLSRNAGLQLARGAFTAIVDGDDLYSFNYLADLHAEATSGVLVMALPSLCVWFDGDWMVLRFEPLSRTGRFRLAGVHTFMSCIMAPTAFLQRLLYRDSSGNTFAYEDWDLNCRAVAEGADVRTADNAALFYRRHSRSIMAGIADKRRLVLPSSFFDPNAFLAAGDGEAIVADGEMLRPGLLALRASHTLGELISHASGIDPRLDLAKVRAATVWTNAMFSRAFGETFYAHCLSLNSARFEAVLVVGRLATAPEAIRRVAETPKRWLIIETVGTSPGTNARADGGAVIALDALGLLSPEQRAEMLVRIMHAFAKQARLHLIFGEECGVLAAYPEAFDCNQIVVYRVAGFDVALPSDAFSIIGLVIFDDEAPMNTLVSREPLYATKVDLLQPLGTVTETGHWLERLEARLETRGNEPLSENDPRMRAPYADNEYHRALSIEAHERALMLAKRHDQMGVEHSDRSAKRSWYRLFCRNA